MSTKGNKEDLRKKLRQKINHLQSRRQSAHPEENPQKVQKRLKKNLKNNRSPEMLLEQMGVKDPEVKQKVINLIKSNTITNMQQLMDKVSKLLADKDVKDVKEFENPSELVVDAIPTLPGATRQFNSERKERNTLPPPSS